MQEHQTLLEAATGDLERASIQLMEARARAEQLRVNPPAELAGADLAAADGAVELAEIRLKTARRAAEEATQSDRVAKAQEAAERYQRDEPVALQAVSEVLVELAEVHERLNAALAGHAGVVAAVTRACQELGADAGEPHRDNPLSINRRVGFIQVQGRQVPK